MPKIKVTQKGIEALVAKPRKSRSDYFDQAHPGLCLTIGPKSASWYYFRRVDGKLVRLKLGEWPLMGIRAAGEAARAQEAAIAEGKHPKTELARKRAEKTVARTKDEARLFEAAAHRWLAQHKPKNRPQLAEQTRRMYERAVRRLVAEFEGRDISTITFEELDDFLDRLKLQSESGIPANHAAATIRLLFKWARKKRLVTINPAEEIEKPVAVAKRDVTLSRDELRVVWKACEDAGYPYGHALRFQIATGQRIGEVVGIRRDEIEDGYWIQTRNKTAKRIDIYLADHAKAVLDDCPNLGPDAPFFTATGDAPVRPDTFHNAIARHIRPRLDDAAKALGLKPVKKHWTPHDLRRTMRTGLTEWAGVLPEFAERAINHSMSGLQQTYDKSTYKPHVAQALIQWDDELTRILKGKGATVTPITSAKRRAAGGRKRAS